ncbi:hypothetical protein SAMN04489760_11446 [Syntrophus gentianae]|uniref:Uncharacterized protein n=1 Tax=Syntrophus gentianae TaxID=43775 RepID=A0A1H7Y7V9_9BACT|nr:PEP-CTERM sorting domain-containing protein [Syntrophus gentianae]SEM41279.1 hypothetical protein SAMN04489760_11446 [Syntrophus gentianae]
MKRWRSTVLSAFLVSVLSVFLFLPTGFAGTLSSSLLASYQQGDKILSDTPTYNWWYGCSPTSAGMMVGYYDRKGYAGLSYSNLVKNGVAEKTTYPSTEGSWDYLAQSAIASKAHVDAFYRNGYLGSGDDIARVGSFDSLADFMGTNQDAHGNSNGSTTFYYWTNGAAFTAQDALDYGFQDDDGMYGIMEYLQYSGYDVPSLTSIYTQAIYSSTALNGFTFDQYKAEIDAGRVVMIQVEGHSMFGYGYGDNGLIYFNDTWTDQENSMTWGGSYAGMQQWGVVCFELTGGSAVPLPPSILLLGFGLAGIGGFRFRNLRRK